MASTIQKPQFNQLTTSFLVKSRFQCVKTNCKTNTSGDRTRRVRIVRKGSSCREGACPSVPVTIVDQTAAVDEK
ncbi:hypothetical protein CEXT_167341 [Caerostris extrusa]|uniref:Uncharacterized protein n=1 Tax=Caerostris extrusa TaxID=172846 RepID=A0AAV4W8A8_CAEEX|nr:hypothetical protein CEXT_167341 [Caerostris extrusa]